MERNSQNYKGIELSEVFTILGTSNYLKSTQLANSPEKECIEYALALHKPFLLVFIDGRVTDDEKELLRGIARRSLKWGECTIDLKDNSAYQTLRAALDKLGIAAKDKLKITWQKRTITKRGIKKQ